MKNILKRSLCLLMALAMVFSLTITASAADSDYLAIGDELLGGTLKVDNTNQPDVWSASGEGASVIITGYFTKATTATLNLKSQVEQERTFSFDYSFKGDVARAKFTVKSTIDNEEVTLASGTDTTTGSEEFRIPAGGTIILKLANKGSVTISNLKFDPDDVQISAVFEPAENGSYKVDGALITETTTLSKSTLESYALSDPAPAEGYSFYGWKDLSTQQIFSNETSYTLSVLEPDHAFTAVFARTGNPDTAPFCVGSSYFDTFADAKAFADDVGDHTIVLVKDYTLNDDLTVPDGITLLIPFDEAHTCFKDKFTFEDGEVHMANQTYAEPTPYVTLTVAQGATLTVEGDLSVSAQHKSPGGSGGDFGPNGPCGFVQLNGGIEVAEGGRLFAYGYVLGAGTVTAESGSEVYELMQIADFRGGNATVGFVGKPERVFPFSQYYIQNIEAPILLNAGAREYAVASLFAGGQANIVDIEFIGPDGMFQMSDGSVRKSYLSGSDRLQIEFNGQGAIDHLAMAVAIPNMEPLSVDSKDYVLPISNNISIKVLGEGSKVVLAQDAAFLPGNEVYVAPGAEVEIAEGNKAYVYDLTEWMAGNYVFGAHMKPIRYSPTAGARPRNDSSLADAVLDINGTLTVSGALYTTASGARIISTEESGKVVYAAEYGEETVTYQALQSDGIVTFVEIPINAAWLLNGDDSFTKSGDYDDCISFRYSAEEDRWIAGVQVSFDANGGEGTMEPQFFTIDEIENEESVLAENGFTNYGNKFVGWAFSPDAETADDAYYCYDPETTEDDWFWGNEDGYLVNTTLYAVWEPVTQYRVTFNANGGTGTMAPLFLALGESAQLTANAFTRIGYTFAGWNTKDDGTGTAYANKATITISEPGDVALYAQWTPKYVTVTFENYDGTTVTTQTVQEGQSPEYPSERPTKPEDEINEYLFDGWQLGARIYVIGEPLPPVTADTTFTAAYTAIKKTYTVTFDPKGGYFQGGDSAHGDNPLVSNIDAGSVITMRDVVRNGYEFLNWNTAEDGNGTAYAIGASYTVTGNVTFYAQWQVKTYTVTFLPGEGEVTGEMAQMSFDYGEQKALTANAFVRPGYDFQFWLDQHGNHYADGATIPATINENLTLTAQWELGEYTLTFDANGGEPVDPFEIVGLAELTLPTTTRVHYVFVGWKDTNTGVVYGPDDTYTVVCDVTFEAQWTPVEYTITFLNYNDEVLQQTAVAYGTMPSYDGETPTRPSTAEFEYSFIGWDPTIHEVDGEETYYAQFSKSTRSYTITFVDEDGTVLQSGEVAYGEMPAYTGETPTKDATAQYTYTFAGWTPEIVAVTGEATYTATYTETVNEYTITFVDEDGTELQSSSVEYGVTPTYTGETPTKDATVQYTYTFAGWTPEIVAVTEDATYTATYTATVNKYTVKFVNDDGTTVLQSEELEYGAMPEYKGETPTKDATAQDTYTFAGWDKEIVAVTGEATYTATYTAIIRTYTITFVDWNGEELSSKDYEYGTSLSMIVRPADPTREGDAQYSYEFIGWTPEVADVTGDATYTATYKQTVNKYTVNWFVDEVLTQSDELEYGAMPVYNGETPTKAATAQYTYTFKGWSINEIETEGETIYDGVTVPFPTVTGETNFYARFDATVNEYTITFQNEDGTVLQNTKFAYGAMPVYNGEVPTKTGDVQYRYVFAGWDPEITEVTGEATYTATFTQVVNKYLITWKNDNGDVIYSENVEYGQTPVYDTETYGVPTKAATAQYTYTFSGWTPEIAAVTGEATYTATYESTVNTYTVTWVVEGETVETDENVPYGTVPTYDGETPTKEGTDETEYVFAGWDPAVAAIEGDTTYTAKFTEKAAEYQIRFLNDDGTVLQSSMVAYGEMPSYDGETPTKDATAQYTYTFKGWTPEIVAVTGPADYTATYDSTVNTYTVTWVVEGETVETDENVPYGTTPEYNGETPTKQGNEYFTYTFKEWDPAIHAVDGDVTYTAVFTESVTKFTIKFVNEDGTVLQTSEYEYGETPAYNGETPTKEATVDTVYTFAGWKSSVDDEVYAAEDLPAVSGEATYTATYQSATRQYTVTFVDEDGTTVLKEATAYDYGTLADDIEQPDTPTKAATVDTVFTFDGWDPEIENVTRDATYTATYQPATRYYTITWVIDGASETEKYVYNALPEYKGTTPAKEGDAQYSYTFAGWDKDIVPVTADATYTAVFTQTINTYTVTWVIDGVEEPETYVYGATPSHADPTKATGENEKGAYTFTGWDPEIAAVTGNATYTAQFSYTGWRTDETGKQYFIDNELQKTGLTEIGGKTYYLDPETGYAAVSTVVSVEEGDPGHAFNADGEWLDGCDEHVFTDIKNDAIYLIEDGIVEVYPGLYRTAGSEYYYFGEDNKAVRGQVSWVEKNHASESNVRGLLPKWDYEFADNGVIIHKDVDIDGIVKEREGVFFYYIDGIRVHYGMFKATDPTDGKEYYYYARSNGQLVTSMTYWCTDIYDTGFKEGPYTFDEYGRMIVVEKKNGIYFEDNSIFFYRDGSRYYAGLIQVDANGQITIGAETMTVYVHKDGAEATPAELGYYYVRTEGELAHSRSYWITKTNGLKDEKAYAFDENGKMIEKDGIFEEDGSLWYYKEGLRFYAGLIKIGDYYYYVKTDGEVVHGRSYWISKTNGLMPEKSYTFDETGKMIIDVPIGPSETDGIVAKDGTLWYYENGKLTYKGLFKVEEGSNLTYVKADGTTTTVKPGYYYAKTNGEIVNGRSYWISKTNGLLQEKSYTFDADGMITNPGV